MRAVARGNPVDRGWLAAVSVVALTSLMALAGPGSLAQYFFVALATAETLWLLARGRHLAALEFVLLVWALSPGVRRFVDYYSSYHSHSVVLAVPPVLGVLVGLAAIREARWVSLDSVTFFVLLAVSLAFATITGASTLGLTAAGTGLISWLGPLGLGLGALLVDRSDDRLRRVIVRSAFIVTLTMGAYGIVQFFVLPVWDATWISEVYSVANSFGLPHPQQVRVFSLSSSPSSMALLVLWSLLVVAFSDYPLVVRAVIVALGLTALELSEVRAAWLAGAVILAILLVRGVVRGRSLIAAGVAAALILTFVGGDFEQRVTDRLSSLTAGTQDESLQARLILQNRAMPVLLRSPVGNGFGSTGSAARLSQSAGGGELSAALSNADSGYLEMLSNFGPILSAILLAALLILVATAARVRRRKLDVAIWAFVASGFVSLYFNDVFTDIAGAAMLLSLGYLGRPDGFLTPPELSPRRSESRAAESFSRA